ncbi:hypothetical protein N657DRAFT_678637 [Parathielavia appendiculata]|uniref:Uncharacterized protein n=1 Tax=Parathielavia appendiculata TaxID=2587402 RepID=A0AAN6U334_9PEZI|nr:hypothetical protein N657DRAFT_678637 [Parathielavia appendiculata]
MLDNPGQIRRDSSRLADANPASDAGGNDSDDDDLVPDLSVSLLSMPRFTTEHKQAQHDAWVPFAQFLAQLPGLQDLVYACTSRTPACVPTALHQHHSRSCLHMRAFILSSLDHQQVEQVHGIDPDEFALVTSPCLYRINTTSEIDTQSAFA